VRELFTRLYTRHRISKSFAAGSEQLGSCGAGKPSIEVRRARITGTGRDTSEEIVRRSDNHCARLQRPSSVDILQFAG
jgi:hypothetical protein